MTARSPTAFVAVCALHAVLAWALLVAGGGRLLLGPAQPSPTAFAVVPVNLIATLRPRPATPKAQPPAAAFAQQEARKAPQVPQVARLPAPAVPAELSVAPGQTAQALSAPAVEQSTVAAAEPSAARAETASIRAAAPAAAPEPAPTRTEPTPSHPAPAVLAHADRQRCPPAPHPAALRERGIEGAVVLRVKVDAQGRPADVQVQSGSGWRLFDEAALQQVRACRFIPATQGSQAVDSWVEFPVRFALAG